MPLVTRILFFGINPASQGLIASVNAFWGSLLAIVLGIFLVRNVGRYPGVEKAAAIIPGFSMSFGALAVGLLMLRLDYSRAGLLGSYCSVIGIFYLAYAQIFGRKILTIGVIPSGASVQALKAIDGVHWRTLNTPDCDISRVDAIAVDLRMDLPDIWEKQIADFALAGIPVYHSKHLVESLTGRVELEHPSETSFGTLSPPNALMFPKYVLDRLIALIALIFLSPFLGIVAVLVRLDSPGPSIFQQQRVGFRGHPFTVYKFRTMRIRDAAAPALRDEAITRENDNRITRLGKFLRRTRIDELPQIANILKGDMSWIGPRPEAAVLAKWYEDEIPFYRYRHIVRPGLTGWAQVMQGHVAELDEVRNKLYYDFYYIKNFSVWIDVLIIFRTIIIVFTGFGSK